MNSEFDVIVIGAGHAGVESALACARLGLRTALLTSNIHRIGYMSCNPSIGGLAKGHMVREIDVLGGQMGQVSDATCLQFKRLNSSRGPAVRGTRMQNDKEKYSRLMSQIVHSQPYLSVFEGEAKSLIIEKGTCRGISISDGSKIFSKSVVMTTGTFMNAVMFTGSERQSGGRVGDQATSGLSDQLKDFGFSVRRLKTGTPARLISESIDWSKTITHGGDENFYPFSFRSPRQPVLQQITCGLTRTTERTHEIIRDNLDQSPMYCGLIEGTGPRYCPSIEDKVVRFSDRTSHQTFLEPESLETNLIYLQGISTSLPKEVQDKFIRTIPGLEHVQIARYGYAVEYDFIEPTQIHHRLECRNIAGLFLAGQINGTSGYEEAAAQGLIAGINAAHYVLNREEIILRRDQSYIGVMIDDLVTKGTREPYRMFTSRAEHRLVLREDNTIDRLFSLSQQIGLADQDSLIILEKIKSQRELFHQKLKETKVFPNSETQDKLVSIGTTPLLKSITLEELLRRPEVTPERIFEMGLLEKCDQVVSESVEIEVKYSGYIQRQMLLIEQLNQLENKVIPDDFDYNLIKGLSAEERQKLSSVKPRTLGQAQRISGVNPSALQAIMISLKSRKLKEPYIERRVSEPTSKG